jgi:hypothetical protein
MLRWALGGLEAHLTEDLARSLQQGSPFAAYEAELAQVRQAADIRAAALAEAEAALLAATRIEALNPARLRLIATHPLPAPPTARLAEDLAAAQQRWVVAAGAGVVAAALAQRVVAGLAARGLLGTAARVALRAGGVLVAVGVDAALIALDEHLNRDQFRTEILADLEQQRQAARAALMPPAP